MNLLYPTRGGCPHNNIILFLICYRALCMYVCLIDSAFFERALLRKCMQNVRSSCYVCTYILYWCWASGLQRQWWHSGGLLPSDPKVLCSYPAACANLQVNTILVTKMESISNSDSNQYFFVTYFFELNFWKLMLKSSEMVNTTLCFK